MYLLCRTANLLADLNDTGVLLSEKPPEAISIPETDDDVSSIDGQALISLDVIEQISNMSSGKTVELWNTAHTLLEDVDRWLQVLKRERTEHERVHLGNLAYANAMKVSAEHLQQGSTIDETSALARFFSFMMSSVATERTNKCKSAV